MRRSQQSKDPREELSEQRNSLLVAVKIGLSLLCCKNRQKAGVAGAQCQGETSPGRSWRGVGGEQTALASQDMEEALDFMGSEKGNHMEAFIQDSEFVFHQDQDLFGPCLERRLEGGPKAERGKSGDFYSFPGLRKWSL